MANYTSQEKVEAYLKRALSENEVLLFEVYRSAVQKFIDSKIGGSYGEVVEGTKYYNGGKRIIDIDGVRDVVSVKEVDSEGSVLNVYDLEDDISLMPLNDSVKRWIEMRYGGFPVGIRNIQVVGKFSLGDVPEDIQYVSTIMVGTLISEGFDGKLTSESIEGYSRTFAVSLEKGDLSARREIVETILSAYVENGGIMI